MDCFPSQPSFTEYYSEEFYPEDTQSLGQFEWNPPATDHSLNFNLDVPGTFPDNLFDPIFTPEQLASLLQCADSPSPSASLPTDFSGESLAQSEWNLQPFPELAAPSAESHFVQSSHPPMVFDSATYRDGFGNPIPPADYRPYEPSAGYDTYSSPPPMASSGFGPSDPYAGYTYSMSHPPPPVEKTNPWDLVASSAYLPPKASARSDVTSPSAASEQPVKKHRCQTCGRAFQRQTTLTQHQITHTGERPYSCPVTGCDKAFTTASNAKRHAKTHFRISHGYHPLSPSSRPY